MGYYEDALMLAERLGTTVAPRDRTQSRVIRDRATLARVVDERISFLGLPEERVADTAGVSLATVLAMRDHGSGSLDEMWSVLDAIKIYPVCLPDPSEPEERR